MEHLRNDHNDLSMFVDTDAFIASLKADDPNHTRARTLFEQLKARPVRFLTSNYVFAEAITVLSQRVSKSVALVYIDTMTAPDSPFQIKRADEVLEAIALQIFREQTSKNTSYVDCTTMAFLKQYHLDAIFSFDHIYKKNGFLLANDWGTAEHAA